MIQKNKGCLKDLITWIASSGPSNCFITIAMSFKDLSTRSPTFIAVQIIETALFQFLSTNWRYKNQSINFDILKQLLTYIEVYIISATKNLNQTQITSILSSKKVNYTITNTIHNSDQTNHEKRTQHTYIELSNKGNPTGPGLKSRFTWTCTASNTLL